jgi:uncharacterized protein YbcI
MPEELAADSGNPSGTDGDPSTTTAGELNAAVAREVVRVYRAYAGRGPTKARAFFRADIVVVLLEHVMTTAERTLVEHGRIEAARAARQQLREAMRTDLVRAVETVTGGTVRASMSDSDVEADVAAEVFVFDRSVGDGDRADGRS